MILAVTMQSERAAFHLILASDGCGTRYKRAAERGDSDAQYNYGLMVIYGEGGPADAGEGLEWIRRAAEQKHVSAISYLSQKS